MLTKDYYPLSPALDTAFKDSDLLVEEADLGDLLSTDSQLQMLMRGMLPAEQSLEKVVSRTTFAEVSKRVGDLGLPIEPLQRFKPWMLAMTLEALEWQKAGFDADLGLDKHFYDRAHADSKQIQGLETTDYQISRFDGMTFEQQDRLLADTLKGLDSEMGNVNKLADAWKAGDAPGRRADRAGGPQAGSGDVPAAARRAQPELDAQARSALRPPRPRLRRRRRGASGGPGRLAHPAQSQRAMRSNSSSEIAWRSRDAPNARLRNRCHAGRLGASRGREPLVGPRHGARGRLDGGPRHREPGPRARRRVRRGAVSESRPRAGRHQRLHPAGDIQDAHDRRSAFEPRARGRRQDRAAHAGRGREHQRAHRSRALGRRAARVRRVRLQGPGDGLRRSWAIPPSRRPEEQRGRVSRRQPVRYSRSVARALPVRRRAMGGAQAGGRHRHDRHPEPDGAWRFRGRDRRWRGCSRRCRSPTRRSTMRPGSSWR